LNRFGRQLGNLLANRSPAAAAWLAGASTAAIAFFLFASAWPVLTSGRLVETFSLSWRPYAAEPSYGIGAMILASALLALVATALAAPLALGLVAFLQGIGPKRLRPPLLRLVQFMTSIPTVVYGFVAVIVLVPLIREYLGGSGFSLLGAVVMLALLVLPTVVLVWQAHVAQGERGVLNSCLALGMSPAQALACVILPASRRSAVSALVLGFCRALGDTLIALMVAGNATEVPGSLLDSARALTAHIALVLATDAFSPEYRSVAAAACLLFLLTAGISLGLRRLEDGEVKS
jgi:phosphate transport system permease protein